MERNFLWLHTLNTVIPIETNTCLRKNNTFSLYTKINFFTSFRFTVQSNAFVETMFFKEK